MKIYFFLILIAGILAAVGSAIFLKTKKKILALFSLIISLVSGGVLLKENTISAEQQNSKLVEVKNKNLKNQTVQHNQDNKIYKTKEWADLSVFWRRINNFGTISDWQTKMDKAQKLNQELNIVLNKLNSLQHKTLITQEQNHGLTKIMQERVAHIQRNYSGATCYDMSQEGQITMETLEDLEQQNKSLESLYKTGKINDEIFNKIKQTIESDLQKLNINTNPSVIKLVIELNKEI